MQRKNIPNYVLAKGISKDGFEQLLQDIRNAVMEEGVNEFSNYSELLNFIKEKDGDNAEKWISEFEGQLNESVTIINENMAKIEGLFSRIFADWEVYKEEHNIVEEPKEEVKEEVKAEEGSVAVEQPVVEVTETPEVEVKVELEPVVVEESTVSVEETNTEVPVEETTVSLEQPAVEATETPEVEVKEEATEEVKEEKPKKEKKSKKDKSEAEGDNNG